MLDASAVLRALVDGDSSALAWLERARAAEITAVWPELAVVEIANALATLARARRLDGRASAVLLARALALPARSEPLSLLVEPALALALARSLTVYDACYVVLAETLRAPLVTTDRTLAAATENAVLITR